jgi:hypothetical protein
MPLQTFKGNKMTTTVTDQNFNPTNNEQVEEIKAASNALALIISKTPQGRRQSVALTHLETASMFAVKSIFAVDQG